MSPRYRLATSYWAAGARIMASGLQPVSISRGQPTFAVPFGVPPILWGLAPTRAEFDLRDDPAAFSNAYSPRIEKLGAARILSSIQKAPGVSAAQGAVLLCYERDRRQCHRGLLAALLEREGYACPELEPLGLVDVGFEQLQLPGRLGHDRPDRLGDSGMLGLQLGGDVEVLGAVDRHRGEHLPGTAQGDVIEHAASLPADARKTSAGVPHSQFGGVPWSPWREPAGSAKLCGGSGLAVARKEIRQGTSGEAGR
jgi:hypothetical protein